MELNGIESKIINKIIIKMLKNYLIQIYKINFMELKGIKSKKKHLKFKKIFIVN